MKNITIFSIVYLALVGFCLVIFASDLLSSQYLFSFDLLSYHFEYSLSYAVLIVAPLVIYVVIFLLGFSGYAFSRVINERRVKKDAKYFEQYCAALVLGTKIPGEFRSSTFKQLAPFLKELANNQASADGSLLSEALSIRAILESGGTTDAKLAKNSALDIKNRANLCASNIAEAKDYLKNKSEIDDAIAAAAYENLLANADYKDIKMLKITKDSSMCMKLLNRLAAGTIELSSAEIEVLLSTSSLDAAQYLQAAKILRHELDAQVLQALFNKLKSADEAASRAYLYVLAALGLNDEFMQELSGSEAGNEDFKLVLFLKEHSQKYELDELIH